MKKSNKKYLRDKTIKDLAEQFTNELDQQLSIAVMPNGSAVYKDYVIKQNSNGNWGLYDANSKDLVNQYYLKTCALLAAKAYSSVNMEKYIEVKRLDNQYWASYCDYQVYKKNIKTAKEFERYLILLNKLEDSKRRSEHFKEEISRMFKWSFV